MGRSKYKKQRRAKQLKRTRKRAKQKQNKPASGPAPAAAAGDTVHPDSESTQILKQQLDKQHLLLSQEATNSDSDEMPNHDDTIHVHFSYERPEPDPKSKPGYDCGHQNNRQSVAHDNCHSVDLHDHVPVASSLTTAAAAAKASAAQPHQTNSAEWTKQIHAAHGIVQDTTTAFDSSTCEISISLSDIAMERPSSPANVDCSVPSTEPDTKSVMNSRAYPCHCDTLSPDLLVSILEYLDGYACGPLVAVNKEWHRIITSSPYLWRSYCLQVLPNDLVNKQHKRKPSTDWYRVFMENNHVRMDGMYIIETSYQQRGEYGFDALSAPAFVRVNYFRVFRFVSKTEVVHALVNSLHNIERIMQDPTHKYASVGQWSYQDRLEGVDCIIRMKQLIGIFSFKFSPFHKGSNDRLLLEEYVGQHPDRDPVYFPIPTKSCWFEPVQWGGTVRQSINAARHAD
jgi:F-box only protein C-terminal region/F-box-like